MRRCALIHEYVCVTCVQVSSVNASVRMFIRHLSFSPSGGAFHENASADEARCARAKETRACARTQTRASTRAHA
eukprot:4493076-Pleurochrysis_carterae.AAC.1